MTTVPSIKMAPDGPQVSRLVSGMMNLSQWQLGPEKIVSWIHACLDVGISTFDHADIYGSYVCERLFGEALAKDPSLRTRIQLITKCGIKLISPNRQAHTINHYDTTKEHIIASVENSLRFLHTDTIDVLLIHRPDPLMDADEVADAFGQLKQSGKVRHFGVSNFTPFQFDLLASRLDFPLVTNQVELSVVNMDVLHNGTIDQCQKNRIAPMAWAPFGGGGLFRAETDQAARLRTTLSKIGEALGGASIDQVALAWIMKHPANVIPILGTGRFERIKTAVSATNLTLTRQQWFAIWVASKGHNVP